MKDTLFSSNPRFNIKGILREFRKPVVMGILNATPDSFYGKSRVNDLSLALSTAERMIKDGTEILDIGGYSSRPGASEVNIEEEIQRTKPLVAAIKKEFPETLISIDTFRAKVAAEAINAGADMINDISGGQLDPTIFEVAAEHSSPYIMMHMRNHPTKMMEDTHYDHLIKDLIRYFSVQVEKAEKAGVKDLIIDPGFGFSKTLEQNYELMQSLELLHVLEKPILVGISRKSMIYKTLETNPEKSLNGTTVLNTIALQKGAQILRVHDVKEAVEAVQLVGLSTAD